MDSINHFSALIGILGALVVSIFTATIKSYLDKAKELKLRYAELMEEKYRYILIMMACILNYDNRKYFSVNEQTPIKSSEDYFRMLKEYYYHGLLYSPDKITLSIKSFIEYPCLEMYVKTAISMRNDLWFKKSQLAYDDILLEDPKA